MVVDLQRDFLEGGAVPCFGSWALLPAIAKLAAGVAEHRVPCIYTRCWHPPDHSSFQKYGGTWPVHCVRNTPGAEFPPDLERPSGSIIIEKGVDRDAPGYSGFEGTDLQAKLGAFGVQKLVVCGVATEHCVQATVLDALDAGFDVDLLIDLVRPVTVDGGERALAAMRQRGASLITSDKFGRSS